MLSIVISHKNRIKQLQRCLNCLVTQKTDYEYEIIVVDGGSDKPVINTLKCLEKSDKIKVYFFNDEKFNVSKYRNYGVKKCQGELITFLDADILVASDFVDIICKKYMKKNNIVLIHTAYGFRINIKDKLSNLFNTITDENIKDIVKIMEFSDFRDSAMEFYGEDLNCPAPWVYGWSGIISISKELFIKSGFFDENFKGWGSEDTDLAYRLWNEKGRFIHEKDAFGIHVAHETNNVKKENQNYLNRRFLYSKYKTLETELYAFLTGVSINNFLLFCQKIHLGALNPIYTTQQIDTINNIINNKRSICVGLDSCQEILRLNFTHYLTLNNNTERIIDKYKTNVSYSRRLGLITDYQNEYFDVCIIFDSYNYLPEELYRVFIEEMKRISRKVYQIRTNNFIPIIYNRIGNFSLQETNKLDYLNF